MPCLSSLLKSEETRRLPQSLLGFFFSFSASKSEKSSNKTLDSTTFPWVVQGPMWLEDVIFVFGIKGKKLRQKWNGLGRCGAAWWAYQSALRLLRGLSHRRALLQQPFPMAICLCPVSFPFLAPFFPFHLLLPLNFDCSFWPLSRVRSLSPLVLYFLLRLQLSHLYNCFPFLFNLGKTT